MESILNQYFMLCRYTKIIIAKKWKGFYCYCYLPFIPALISTSCSWGFVRIKEPLHQEGREACCLLLMWSYVDSISQPKTNHGFHKNNFFCCWTPFLFIFSSSCPNNSKVFIRLGFQNQNSRFSVIYTQQHSESLVYIPYT